MMRSNNLNWYDHGGYMEMTAPYSNVNVTNNGKHKNSIVNKQLSQSCSTNKNESKLSIANETLLQNCSAKDNELCFTKEDESEYASRSLKN